VLKMTSTGGDPFMSHQLSASVAQTTIVLRFVLKSNSTGAGQVFWTEEGGRAGFHRDLSVRFDAKHDGVVHEYAVQLESTRPLTGVRMDPAAGQGTMELSNIRLTTVDGKLIAQILN
ncbi:MAG: N-acetylgalactosamine 6-sulfate sulfatase (GALNS), partial [Planctomycetota bacterium]